VFSSVIYIDMVLPKDSILVLKRWRILPQQERESRNFCCSNIGRWGWWGCRAKTRCRYLNICKMTQMIKQITILWHFNGQNRSRRTQGNCFSCYTAWVLVERMHILQSDLSTCTLQFESSASVKFWDVGNISPNDSISVLFCWWLPANV